LQIFCNGRCRVDGSNVSFYPWQKPTINIGAYKTGYVSCNAISNKSNLFYVRSVALEWSSNKGEGEGGCGVRVRVGEGVRMGEAG